MAETKNLNCKIIGVCGANGAGKSHVCNFLEQKGFIAISLSDAIRKSLIEDNLELSRDNLIKRGNELRDKHGAGVLAELTARVFEEGKRYVVDSIRHPKEVQELSSRVTFFHLIAVMCDPKIRFVRLQERKRAGDVATFEDFLRVEASDARNPSSSGQQRVATERLADSVLTNDGTPEEFDAKVEVLVSRLLQ
eukprot:GCRY01002286.1.p1 GENE.GCRY01002286.1~~GCRY01002286.1.p1  ORF type:complete len:193 (-),score=34.80 GCRY01002286.1:360-938(-)